MAKIESGKLMDTLLQGFKSVWQSLCKSLEDIGLDVEQSEIKEGHGEKLTVHFEDVDDLSILLYPVETEDGKVSDDAVRVLAEYADEKKDFGDVSNDIQDVINKVDPWFKDFTGISIWDYKDKIDKEKLTASMQIKLNRICSAKEDVVTLTGIRCSTDASLATDTLNDVLNDDEFISAVPEGESCYEVCCNPDGNLDVCEVDSLAEFDGYHNPYVSMLIPLWCNVFAQYTIQPNAKGEMFDKLRQECERISWDCRYQITTLSEWAVAEYGFVPSPAELLADCDILHADVSGYNYQTGLSILQESQQTIYDTMNLHLIELSDDKRLIVAGWMNTYLKNATYDMVRPQLV